MPDLSTWLTKAQACDALGVSERTLDRLSSEGKIEKQGQKISGRKPLPLFNPVDVEKMAAKLRTFVVADDKDTGLKQPISNLPLWLTIRQASAYTGLSMSYLRRRARKSLELSTGFAILDGGWKLQRVALERASGIGISPISSADADWRDQTKALVSTVSQYVPRAT